MLILNNLSKYYQVQGNPRAILENVNLTIAPGDKIGVLGRNGAGKSTFVRIISGAENPTSGQIIRNMTVSWPIAFAGGFQGSLSGYDNVKFICRIYGKNYAEALPFIEEFTELGAYLYEPIRIYSSGMRAKLAFAISMSVEFDCYLIDEVTAVGDAVFQKKCQEELFVKREDKAMIIVSHNADFIKKHCDKVLVLDKGILHSHDTIDDAYQFYNTL